MQAAFLSTPQWMSDLLQQLPDVLQSDGFTAVPSGHKINHPILTKSGQLVFAKLAFAKAEFSVM